MRRQLQVERELQKKKERQGYELERRERVNEKWLNNKESKHKRVEEDRQQYEYRRYNPPIVYEEDRYK